MNAWLSWTRLSVQDQEHLKVISESFYVNSEKSHKTSIIPGINALYGPLHMHSWWSCPWVFGSFSCCRMWLPGGKWPWIFNTCNTTATWNASVLPSIIQSAGCYFLSPSWLGIGLLRTVFSQLFLQYMLNSVQQVGFVTGLIIQGMSAGRDILCCSSWLLEHSHLRD